MYIAIACEYNYQYTSHLSAETLALTYSTCMQLAPIALELRRACRLSPNFWLILLCALLYKNQCLVIANRALGLSSRVPYSVVHVMCLHTVHVHVASGQGSHMYVP